MPENLLDLDHVGMLRPGKKLLITYHLAAERSGIGHYYIWELEKVRHGGDHHIQVPRQIQNRRPRGGDQYTHQKQSRTGSREGVLSDGVFVMMDVGMTWIPLASPRSRWYFPSACSLSPYILSTRTMGLNVSIRTRR